MELSHVWVSMTLESSWGLSLSTNRIAVTDGRVLGYLGSSRSNDTDGVNMKVF